MQNGEKLRELKDEAYWTYKVMSVSYHPEGHQLASGGDDGKVRLWDVETGRILKLYYYASTVMSLAWNRIGDQLVAGLLDGVLEMRRKTTQGRLDLQWSHRSSSAFFFHSATITGARGLLPQNRNLFRQHGAKERPDQGQDSDKQNDNQEINDLLQQRDFSHIPVTKIYSVADDSLLLSPQFGVVSMMRIPRGNKSNSSEHAFIMIEGMDCKGQCLILRYDLCVDKGSWKIPNAHGKVEVRSKIKISPKDYKSDFKGECFYIENADFCAESWRINQETFLQLYERLQSQLNQKIPYNVLGDVSIFAQSSKASKFEDFASENCYTWARKQLVAVLGESEVRQKLPIRYCDYIATVPSAHL